MYGFHDVSRVNTCRYQMFASKQSQSHCLPPCPDAIKQHIMRANYQAAVWRHGLIANLTVPSPEGHGWMLKNGCIELNWMSLPPAPAALLDLIICGCTGNCSTGHCTCHRNSISCTDASMCGDDCANPHNVWQGSGNNEDENYNDLAVDDDDDNDYQIFQPSVIERLFLKVMSFRRGKSLGKIIRLRFSGKLFNQCKTPRILD